MRPFPSTAGVSFGPGPITPAVKLILILNVGMFVLTMAAPAMMVGLLGLTPAAVIEQARVWQLVAYLFVH